jgi:hypothetical protein
LDGPGLQQRTCMVCTLSSILQFYIKMAHSLAKSVKLTLSIPWRLSLMSAVVLQQVIAEAHQHVTSELISRLIDEYHLSHSPPNSADDDTHNQENAMPETMEIPEDT